ncbi:ferritin-like domain-containing protein [Sciscionella marina]|uniref:ferritin-like domain-containing protein n=1 Tax=Sciscionella marina TaxID=508770 RepID=UPI00037D3BE4|nr:ferritin-like domain-containing protein [Sciscionella marina]
MFGKKYAASMINRSAENDADRRRFLRSAGLTGLGVVGASALGGGALSALDAPAAHAAETANDAGQLSDASVLNFALNLEYLESQFYLHAVTGAGLPASMTGGTGKQGGVTGGRAVPFRSQKLRSFAREIAGDEHAHVKFLRTALGSAAVAQPAIDLQHSFTAAAQAAGIVAKGHSFDAFACEENFLLAAFLFEDVGVTAYKGAAPLVQNKTYLEAAAGILATEAYHAANVRTELYQTHTGLLGTGLFGRDLREAAGKFSDARDSLDGKSDDDQGIVDSNGQANIVPTDGNGVAYSRSAPNVLNIVYLTPKQASSGGFFPAGVNGDIITSSNNS